MLKKCNGRSLIIDKPCAHFWFLIFIVTKNYYLSKTKNKNRKSKCVTSNCKNKQKIVYENNIRGNATLGTPKATTKWKVTSGTPKFEPCKKTMIISESFFLKFYSKKKSCDIHVFFRLSQKKRAVKLHCAEPPPNSSSNTTENILNRCTYKKGSTFPINLLWNNVIKVTYEIEFDSI